MSLESNWIVVTRFSILILQLIQLKAIELTFEVNENFITKLKDYKHYSSLFTAYILLCYKYDKKKWLNSITRWMISPATQTFNPWFVLGQNHGQYFMANAGNFLVAVVFEPLSYCLQSKRILPAFLAILQVFNSVFLLCFSCGINKCNRINTHE